MRAAASWRASLPTGAQKEKEKFDFHSVAFGPVRPDVPDTKGRREFIATGRPAESNLEISERNVCAQHNRFN